MKTQVNPLAAVIVLVLVVAGIGYLLWSQAGGKTFTKSEASGRMGAGLDLGKMEKQIPQGAPK